jgi:hypothetical protein
LSSLRGAHGPLQWKVAGLVLIPLLVVAVVGLPLFQDGSSYLLELMTSRSAVRHHRYAVLLLQAPAIAALELSGRAGIDPRTVLPVVSALFRISYALVPFVALAWCWLLVRKHGPGLMLWPATTVLLLNVVNFSGVSEILAATQLAFALLFAAAEPRPTRFGGTTLLVLTPLILMLHALAALLFIGLACGMALHARRLDSRAGRAWALAGAFAFAACVRLALDAWISTDYERGMWTGQALGDYFSAGLETACFLAAATASALWFAASRNGSGRLVTGVSVVLVAVNLALAVQNLTKLIRADEQPLVLLVLIGGAALAMASLAWRAPGVTAQIALADRAVLALPWSAACALMARYTLLGSFPLKTGATVVIAAALIVLAALDAVRDHAPAETQRRGAFVVNAAAVFAVLVLAKAAIWDAANARLEQTLATSTTDCVETSDPSMNWVRRSPGAILNNWSLPSLALVGAPRHPVVLVLEAGDCARFALEGEVVVDPWTVLTRRQLPFVFGTDRVARRE